MADLEVPASGEVPRSKRSRGRVVAVSLALVIGAVIAASAVVAVVTYVRHQDHADACQRLREELPVVMVVPQPGTSVDQTALTALPSADQKIVKTSVANFHHTVAKELAAETSADPTATTTTNPLSTNIEGNSLPTADSVTSEYVTSWKAFASKFGQGVIEAQGC